MKVEIRWERNNILTRVFVIITICCILEMPVERKYLYRRISHVVLRTFTSPHCPFISLLCQSQVYLSFKKNSFSFYFSMKILWLFLRLWMMVNKHFYPLGPCENSLNLEKITGKNIYISPLEIPGQRSRVGEMVTRWDPGIDICLRMRINQNRDYS
jgi:hypothetical protein